MHKFLLISTLVFCFLRVHAHEGNPVFIANEGQWAEDYALRTEMVNGQIYFHTNRILFQLTDPRVKSHIHAHHKYPDDQDGLAYSIDENGKMVVPEHTYQVSWVGGNKRPEVIAERKLNYHHNYFIGVDKRKWKSKVGVYRRVRYAGIYSGIDMRWYGEKETLKYDFRLDVGADPGLIAMKFDFLDSLQIIDGKLHLFTSLGKIVEQKPFAYQVKNGVYIKVDCQFVLQDNILTFQLGKYDPDYELVIDPSIVFSSFTGSVADNWGFTATYDHEDAMYAGGMVFNMNYPTSTGAYQTTYGGGNTDVSIFKFSPDGTAMEYSTFLGGNNSEQPHSMIVTPDKELVVFGTTSSLNFPTTTSAHQTTFGGGGLFTLPGYTFNNGSDIFITKFDSTGSALLGSTFYGGSANDGINLDLIRNYGDYARGEVFLDSLDNVYIASMTNSANLTLPNAAFSTYGGGSDAILLKFSPNLNTLLWGTYFGGFNHDAAYSVRIYQQRVYIAGGTLSPDIPVDSSNPGYSITHNGNIDGFIARFNMTSGAFEGSTYYGTGQYDQIFFIDTDRMGSVYALGQTKGVIPMSSGKYGQSDGKQFITKFNEDLTSVLWNTNIGNSNGDLVSPSAFEVDNCNAILFSAWGGVSNNPSPFFNNLVPEQNGFTNGLPVTPNAFQLNTDGSDFYFCALAANATALEFATFFGGTANEHVDGGTSRFSPNGIIYQAVCAACGGGTGNTFPTTPGVFAPNRPSSTNCNKAGIKIDFNRSVEANANVDISTELDSLCNGFMVSFGNASNNANGYFWDFGNGVTSTDSAPTVLFVGPNVYTVMLVAMDTNCNLFDTVYLQVPVESFINPVAAVTVDYNDCDPQRFAQFSIDTTLADYIEWNFGDGSGVIFDSVRDTTHVYPGPGVYSGYMVAHDSICGQTDTVFFSIEFIDLQFDFPEVRFEAEECKPLKLTGRMDISGLEPNRYTVEWYYDGNVASGSFVEMNFSSGGFFTVRIVVYDGVCNTEYEKEYDVKIEASAEELQIPNTFTPNGDGKNDVFTVLGDPCIEDAALFIYNRWGQVMFETRQPFEVFWDGYFEGNYASPGVYYYLYVQQELELRGTIHLYR
ncbi:MAG: gliding motility-associated C-terminal domain-containing protein [Cryomorphaceae bacterium]|nr:gliding motility-associated C-terminal domain-containing protein [Cryomorphaceae bacterium]